MSYILHLPLQGTYHRLDTVPGARNCGEKDNQKSVCGGRAQTIITEVIILDNNKGYKENEKCLSVAH